MEFDQIYAILDDPSKGKAQDWADRYKQHLAYQKYIVEPLQSVRTPSARKVPRKNRMEKLPGQRAGSTIFAQFRQFLILSARNIKILSSNQPSLILMLLVPILVASLDFFLAPAMGKHLYDHKIGNAANAFVTIFLLAIDCLLVGGFSPKCASCQKRPMFATNTSAWSI